MILQIVYLLCGFSCIEGLDVLPERPILDYTNPKYIRSMNLSSGRRGRRSPYFINIDVETCATIGNNIMFEMVMLEALTAGYQPTPLQAQYRFCDFLYKEPFLGQMYAKQLPANWSCPFPAGVYNAKNLVTHLENFPFNIPFTSPSMIVRIRADIQG